MLPNSKKSVFNVFCLTENSLASFLQYPWQNNICRKLSEALFENTDLECRLAGLLGYNNAFSKAFGNKYKNIVISY